MRGVRRKQGRAQRFSSPGQAAPMPALPGPVTGGQASPPAPMVMPLAEVLVSPVTQPGYVTLGYRGLVPIWAPDGQTIPARAPGRWAQLRAAGRT